MASVFDVNSVLYFGNRPPGRVRRRLLLWPMWMYRVSAPEVRSREINLFEKAILRLAQTGVTEVERVAGLLEIDPHLVAHIQAELEGRRLLASGQPTSDALAILEEESEEQERIVVGHVFQDPWTRELWPRFICRLSWAEAKPPAPSERLLASVFVDDRSEGVRAMLVRTDGAAEPALPEPYQIVTASRRHRMSERSLRDPASRRKHQRIDDMEEEDALMDQRDVSSNVIARISMIDPQPVGIYVAVMVYVPEEPDEGLLWQSWDPFGLGTSQRLRQRIAQRMEESPDLRKWVNGLITDEVKQATTSYRAQVSRMERAAKDFVEDRLTTAVLLEPQVYEHLVAMQRTMDEARAEEFHFLDKLEKVAVEAQKAVEAMLQSLARRHSTIDAWRLVSKRDHEQRRLTLFKAAQQLCFNPIPEGICWCDDVRQLQKAAEKHNQSLRLMLQAALLAATQTTDHPLRMVAERMPDFLDRLLQLIATRNKGAHATRKRWSASDIEALIETTYSAVAALLGQYPMGGSDDV